MCYWSKKIALLVYHFRGLQGFRWENVTVMNQIVLSSKFTRSYIIG